MATSDASDTTTLDATNLSAAEASLPPLERSLGFLLADATRLTRRACAGFLEEHQLTLAQMRALMCVVRNPGIRQVDVADLLEVQPITLARLVDLLAETGLVERRQDPKDRRAFQLFVTPLAAPIVAAIGKSAAVFQEAALAGLSPEEQDILFSCLNRVRGNLSALLR